MNVISKRAVLDTGGKNFLAILNNEAETISIKEMDISVEKTTEVDFIFTSLDKIRQIHKGHKTDLQINSSILGDIPDEITVLDNPVLLEEGTRFKSFNPSSYEVLIKEVDNIQIPEGMALVIRLKNGMTQHSVTMNILLDLIQESNGTGKED